MSSIDLVVKKEVTSIRVLPGEEGDFLVDDIESHDLFTDLLHYLRDKGVKIENGTMLGGNAPYAVGTIIAKEDVAEYVKEFVDNYKPCLSGSY
ncbi:hypothetical protein KY332_02290 [Candidatus Woesearchaeota archaeon]|nr:hypothetical protein [Candidatus Woesearchaeota archaeon]